MSYQLGHTATFFFKNETERKAKEFLKDTISDISHQLKTPLAALTMYQEIIESEPENAETVKQFAAKMGISLKRMEQLILSMLKITRLDTGNIIFEKKSCRVSELIAHSVNDLTTRAKSESKQIQIDGDGVFQKLFCFTFCFIFGLEHSCKLFYRRKHLVDSPLIIRGLDSGGDDYITKPFKLGELCSRIRALLRRARVSKSEKNTSMECGDITIDLLGSRATLKGKALDLTSAEYRLLCLLVRNANRVVTRDIILNELWDDTGNFVDDNTLSVYVRRLREKVETNPSHPEHLITIRGFGYQWKEVSI